MKTTFKAAAIAATAWLAASAPAMAQSIDEQVNALFANSTGWFVNFIFSTLPGHQPFLGSSPGWLSRDGLHPLFRPHPVSCLPAFHRAGEGRLFRSQ
jgi:hypothetical protein